jgi:hypothetical protein
VTLSCTFCGDPEWFAVKPGQAGDATPLTPNQRQEVLLFPSREPEISSVVWCWSCHPLSRAAASAGYTAGIHCNDPTRRGRRRDNRRNDHG